jgi:chromosome segregation ATPase
MAWMDIVQEVQANLFRDESFNSITGLNGSGKSNILDAICFVLGITNMSTVRAQNLQARPPFGSSIGITVGRI